MRHRCGVLKSTITKEAGIDLYKMGKTEIKISDELTEKIIKRFAVVHMACAYPHSSFSYNPKRDKKQLLCDYLNEYCKVVYLPRTQGVSSSEIRSEKRKINLIFLLFLIIILYII